MKDLCVRVPTWSPLSAWVRHIWWIPQNPDQCRPCLHFSPCIFPGCGASGGASHRERNFTFVAERSFAESVRGDRVRCLAARGARDPWPVRENSDRCSGKFDQSGEGRYHCVSSGCCLLSRPDFSRVAFMRNNEYRNKIPVEYFHVYSLLISRLTVLENWQENFTGWS